MLRMQYPVSSNRLMRVKTPFGSYLAWCVLLQPKGFNFTIRWGCDMRTSPYLCFSNTGAGQTLLDGYLAGISADTCGSRGQQVMHMLVGSRVALLQQRACLHTSKLHQSHR